MQALSDVRPNDDLETIDAGRGVVYWGVRTDAVARAALSAMARRPVCHQLTVRSYGLVVGLAELVGRITGQGHARTDQARASVPVAEPRRRT